MQKFGDCFGVDHKEVLEWVTIYVHGPWPESLKNHLEKTPAERFESIKQYINFRINNSLTEKIKCGK